MFYLSVAIAPNIITQVIYLEKSHYTIGRHSNCDIVLGGDRHISRIHCTLVVAEENFKSHCLLIDGSLLGEASINGTWVNGARINKVKLKHQDVITFGGRSDSPRITFYCEITEGGDTAAHEFD